MRNNIFYLFVLVMVFISCSNDKDPGSDATPKSVVTQKRIKGEVPKEKAIHTIADNPNYTLTQLIAMYKKDVSGTVGEDYAENLKSMWVAVLNPKLFTEGTDAQKVLFVREQMTFNNNLADLAGFYNLLAISKAIKMEEKLTLADAFYNKNLKVIESANKDTPKQKENWKMNLTMAKRNFTMLMSAPITVYRE